MEAHDCDVTEAEAEAEADRFGFFFFFFFGPQGYTFPPWSQPLTCVVNTKALSKGPGAERKA